jgi:hypothetical protein
MLRCMRTLRPAMTNRPGPDLKRAGSIGATESEILRSAYEVVAFRGKLNEGACREGVGTELSAEP